MNDLLFTFFPSYYAYAKDLPAKERLAFYDAILRYFFEGVECEADSPVYKAFMLVKPSITASLRMKQAKMRRKESGNTSVNTSANTCGNTSANTSANTCGNTSANTPSYKEEEEGRRKKEQESVCVTRAPVDKDFLHNFAAQLGIPQNFADEFAEIMRTQNWAYINPNGKTVPVGLGNVKTVLGAFWRNERKKRESEKADGEEITPEVEAALEMARKAGKH